MTPSVRVPAAVIKTPARSTAQGRSAKIPATRNPQGSSVEWILLESSHNKPCQNQSPTGSGLGGRPFGFRQGSVMKSSFPPAGAGGKDPRNAAASSRAHAGDFGNAGFEAACRGRQRRYPSTVPSRRQCEGFLALGLAPRVVADPRTK